jgi:hypothetical protein
MCGTIHYLQTSQTAQQIVHNNVRGWVSVEDIRAYLFSQRLPGQTPMWNLSNLYSIADIYGEFIDTCQLSQNNAREVLDFFHASSLFVTLSDNSARDQIQDVHQISLVLPSARHRLLPLSPTIGPSVEPYVAQPAFLSGLQAGRRDRVGTARQTSFNQLLATGLLHNSFQNGERALARVSELYNDEER